MESDHDHDLDEPLALPKLTAALRRTHSAAVFVPPAIDAAVLRAAREHLGAPASLPARRDSTILPARMPALPGLRALLQGFKARSFFPGWLRWASLATACVLLGLFVLRLTRSGVSPEPIQAYLREDMNHDGRVDILDAFQLARQLESGVKSNPQLDVNGDGVVDRGDVQLIAAQAVKLLRGGRS